MLRNGCSPWPLAALALSAFVTVGCSGKPARIHPPSINASSAGSAAMEQYDLNGDGKVAGEELEKAPSLKAALARLDTNGDGAVSADEVTARIVAWQDSRVGRMSGTLTVLANGKPLEGATVTLVPEAFLGGDIKPATGVTDAGGVAMPTIEVSPEDPPGVPPGFYLVQVTKDGMTIPPMYNTETVLGVEFAPDAIEMEEGITFNLK